MWCSRGCPTHLLRKCRAELRKDRRCPSLAGANALSPSDHRRANPTISVISLIHGLNGDCSLIEMRGCQRNACAARRAAAGVILLSKGRGMWQLSSPLNCLTTCVFPLALYLSLVMPFARESSGSHRGWCLLDMVDADDGKIKENRALAPLPGTPDVEA